MKTMTILGIFLLAGIFSYGQGLTETAKAVEKANLAEVPDTAKHWHFSGFGSLNVTQAAYANWSAGGDNSLGLIGLVNLNLNYMKGKHAWANIIDLGYGFQLQGRQ